MRELISTKKAKDVTARTLKEMNLHEVINLGRVHAMRVWGGWIYWCFAGPEISASVFVPQRTLASIESDIKDDEEPRQLTEAEKVKARKLADEALRIQEDS